MSIAAGTWLADTEGAKTRAQQSGERFRVRGTCYTSDFAYLVQSCAKQIARL
jgi:hypothetical protein